MARQCMEQNGEKEKAETRKKERNRGEKEGNQTAEATFQRGTDGWAGNDCT